MALSLSKKKLITTILILTILTSSSPFFANEADAAAQAAMTAQAAGICAGGTAANLVPGVLVLGSGALLTADPGVRYNTLQILCSTLGITPGTAQRENVYNFWFYFFMRIFLRELTMSIVNWINTGFQGNPSFLQDPGEFLKRDIDRTIGNFIQSSDLAFLCEPFKINVKLALGLQYSPFQDQIGCRLTDILKNSDDAYNNFVNGDFIAGGGWESWLSVTTVPQNNQMGAMLIAQSQLDAQINDRSILKGHELDQNNGFLSMKECTRTTTDLDGNVTATKKYKGEPGFDIISQPVGTVTSNSSAARIDEFDGTSVTGYIKEKCEIVTPGTMISDQAKNAFGWDTDALNMADDINEIVGALGNFVVTKAINVGLSKIQKDELSPNDSAWRSGIAQMEAQIGNGTSQAVSNPNARPNPSEYIADNGGITYDGNNPDTNGLTSEKTNLLNTIIGYRANEQNYFNANFAVYTAASTTVSKLTSVIACYNTKLAASGLSNTKITEANNEIALAQATSTQMNSLISAVVPGLNSSQANLTALQTISAQVGAATTFDSFNAARSNLSTLTSSLHTAGDAATASTTAASTLAQIIIPSLQAADTASSSCAVFPN